MSGRFELMPLQRAFVRFVLRAEDGRLLAMSRPFPSAVRTAEAITEFKARCADPEHYRIDEDEDGVWRFVLVEADGQPLAWSPARKERMEAQALAALTRVVGASSPLRHVTESSDEDAGAGEQPLDAQQV